MRISNPSGFTSVLRESTILGEAVEATEVPPGDDEPAHQEVSEVRNVSTDSIDQSSWSPWKNQTSRMLGRLLSTTSWQTIMLSSA